MIEERWRCFVAVPVDAALRHELTTAVSRWRLRADLGGLRWVDPEGWHITLAFLANVDSADISGLASRIAELAATLPSMRLETGGVGGFPTPPRARVAWYGVADRDGSLEGLARGIRGAAGSDPSEAFRAHVTLARARGRPVDLRPWIGEAQPPRGHLGVERIELMRSHLGNGPARYERLASFELGAGTPSSATEPNRGAPPLG